MTHLASVLLPGSLSKSPWVGVVAFGAVLPDLASRIPGLFLQGLAQWGINVPAVLHYPWPVLHMPIGLLGLCLTLPWLFREDQRVPAAKALMLGCVLHLALDLTQHHYGQGYLLAYPLSYRSFELGWIGSEATVPVAPWLALLTGAAWVIRWCGGRSAGKSTPDTTFR